MRRLVCYCRNPDALDTVERAAIARHFTIVGDIEEIGEGDLVLPRFSLLPFLDDIDAGIRARGAELVVGAAEHRFCADMRAWTPLLGALTPRTWYDPDPTSIEYAGPYFVKGIFNSKKHDFATHCYAADREALGVVMGRLLADALIGTQALAVREYVPLAHTQTLAHGLPIADEHRLFIADGTVVAQGPYWTEEPTQTRAVPETLSRDIIAALGVAAPRYYSVDVARRADGGWTVIEINDPSMAGLAGCDAATLYAGLAAALS